MKSPLFLNSNLNEVSQAWEYLLNNLKVFLLCQMKFANCMYVSTRYTHNIAILFANEYENIIFSGFQWNLVTVTNKTPFICKGELSTAGERSACCGPDILPWGFLSYLAECIWIQKIIRHPVLIVTWWNFKTRQSGFCCFSYQGLGQSSLGSRVREIAFAWRL